MAEIPSTDQLAVAAEGALRRMGVAVEDVLLGDLLGGRASGPGLTARTPVTGGTLRSLPGHGPADVERAVERAADAFAAWRLVPAPRRGEVVRHLGNLLRRHRDDLAELVTIEAGKIASEAKGEVQEMIDVCDFAVGLSRQLYGLTMASERPGHRMAEVWHPLGVVGLVTSFNFPVAVWSWNASIALVCGDTLVWKPSERALLTSVAVHALTRRAAAEAGVDDPTGLMQLVLGGPEVGRALVDHPAVALVSATGSTEMGRDVGPRVAARFGRCLLELGGNNAAIVTPSADLDLTVRATAFAAAGTAGQRCTTLRRVIAHRSVHDELVERLAAAYRSLPVGSPLDEATLVGPLIDSSAYDAFTAALAEAGGSVVCGGERLLADAAPDAFYVRPAIACMEKQTPLVLRETFAPILWLMAYDDWDEAVALHNAARHGLSSSLFSLDLREAERFLGPAGSDCGIANVNVGPSGAEIGGAFGGEKETGGGRESGSDAWKAYMRRMTCTVNSSSELPLAQGVVFL